MRTSYCILSLAAAASALQLNSSACEGSDAEATVVIFIDGMKISVSSQEELDTLVDGWFKNFVQESSDSLSRDDLRRLWEHLVI